jgi:hypothetical protein
MFPYDEVFARTDAYLAGQDSWAELYDWVWENEHHWDKAPEGDNRQLAYAILGLTWELDYEELPPEVYKNEELFRRALPKELAEIRRLSKSKAHT